MKRILFVLLAVNCFSSTVFANDIVIKNYSNTVIEDGNIVYQDNYSYNSNDDAEKVEIVIGEDIIRIGNVTKGCGTASYIQSDTNSAMIPLRAVSTAVAGIEQGSSINVSWDSESKSACINFNDKKIVFKSNSNEMTINDEKYSMDNGATAEIKDEQLFVPLRALSKALDVNVSWDNVSKTVTLFK